ncbi:hypothetical protein KDH83_22575 [Achromobacter sp. Marseille-Q0513]|uniref:hypothetical protein n=1 Tax=Achromobacter sp. Marseille-Q0513 TaxID=2829161 RepID=UPI001BA237A1|nr:hypothetical protein [Achromobacter sp. Marseille-Q0513]MBR8656100.1 hypothetical protein [Achromobacter sp. Marseille-Q0513]
MKRRISPGFVPGAAARLGLLAALWMCAGRSAWPQTIYSADVIDGGYRDCSMSRNGTHAVVNFTVDFKAAAGNMAGKRFLSRGISVFGYDETGKPAAPVQMFVAINGTDSSIKRLVGDFLIAHAVPAYPRANWMNSQAFTANVRLEVFADTLNNWPALGVRAANVEEGVWSPVLASAGALYIGPGTQGCQIIDPAKPPPSPVTTEIKVTAPDWDLGELERGKETTRTFAADAQRLCFRYDAKYIEYDKYLISVSNHNGVAENKFLLANTEDGSETVPYALSLAGGGAPMALPSINGLPLTLGKSGRTCLTPTFKVWAGANIKGGDFDDVLTFTITTQP